MYLKAGDNTMTYFSHYERPEGSFTEIGAAFAVVAVIFMVLAAL